MEKSTPKNTTCKELNHRQNQDNILCDIINHIIRYDFDDIHDPDVNLQFKMDDIDFSSSSFDRHNNNMKKDIIKKK